MYPQRHASSHYYIQAQGVCWYDARGEHSDGAGQLSMRSITSFQAANWRPLVALAAIGGMDVLLSDSLTVFRVVPDLASSGGNESLVIAAFFLVPALIFWLRRARRALWRVILLYNAYATVGVLFSLGALVGTLQQRKGEANAGAYYLLWDAGLIWGMTVLVFAIWYWLLDGGGPESRQEGTRERGDFLFTQQSSPLPGWEGWRPDFVDYLYLAFSTATAFSATDTLPLSPRAKLLLMLQAAACLLIVLMLVSRAINMIT